MRAPLVFMLVSLVGCSAESAATDPGAEEAAVGQCTRPAAGPVKVAGAWARPGGFVNVTIEGDAAKVTLSAERVSGAGSASVRPVGDQGYVVSFDRASVGFFRLVAKAKSDGAVAGTVVVRVADDGPRVELEGRSAFLVAGDAPARLAMRAVDPAGKGLRARVKDKGVSVDAAGRLSADLRVTAGMSFVPVTLVDAACNEFPVAVPVVGASSYEGTGTSKVTAGIEALDFVTAALQPKLAELIVIPAVPAPVADRLGFTVHFDGATLPRETTLKLRPRAGGLSVEVRGNVGKLVAKGRVNNNPATITLTNLVVTADVTFQGITPKVAVGRIDGDFTFDLVGYPDWIGSLFEGTIRDACKKAIEDKLPGVIQNTLLSLRGELPLPSMPGSRPSGQPALGYAIRGISGDAQALVVDLTTTRAGAPTFGGGLVAPVTAGAGVAISYDMIDQALYALWEKKAFGLGLDADDLRAAGEALVALEPTLFRGAQVQAVVEAPRVPPLVTPGELAGTIRVAAGAVPVSVFVQSAGFATQLDADVGLIADVAVTGSPTGVKATLQRLVETHVDLRTPSGVTGLRADVASRVVESVLPRLARQLGATAASLDLPAFDLSQAGLPGKRVGVTAIQLVPRPAGIEIVGTPKFIPAP